MNKLRRLLALLLTLALCATLVTPTALAGNAPFVGGSGTPDDPYQIATPEGLDYIRNEPNAHYVLVADITFTADDFAEGGLYYNGGKGWAPIGTYSAPFRGTFDGGDHTVTGLKIYIASSNMGGFGLFFNNYGEIRNLKLADVDLYGDFCTMGAICARNYYLIENCTVSGKVVGDGAAGANASNYGGIAGSNSGWIINCVNNANVSCQSGTTNRVGGIAGSVNYSKKDVPGYIDSCVNNGDITGPSGSTIAGGIVGKNEITNLSAYLNIMNCTNNGAVSAVTAGGIAGSLTESHVYNCRNNGDVTSDSSSAGGIAAAASASNLSCCVNTGNISSVWNSGGIAGSGSGAVDRCLNTGSVSAVAGTGYTNAGGIIASLSSWSEKGSFGSVTNCFNTGSVTAGLTENNKSGWTADERASAGGIVSSASSKTSLRNCYNTGSVTSSVVYKNAEARYGGVAATLYTGASLENCYYRNTVAQGVAVMDGTDPTVKCTLNQMYRKDTYAGFDFDSLWYFPGENTTPRFLLPTDKAVSLSLTRQPDGPLETVEGVWPDLTGLEVTVSYDCSAVFTLPVTREMLSRLDINTVGTHSVPLEMDGITSPEEITVTVRAKSLSSIAVATLPDKVTYIKDEESFDLTGGTLTLIYDNGTEETIPMTADMVTTPDLSAAGTQTLGVFYMGAFTFFDITVIERTAIAVTSLPSKLTYVRGQPLQTDGGELTVTFSNGSTDTVSLGHGEVSLRYDREAEGTVAVTAEYKGLTATFDITVSPRKITDVALYAPTRLQYHEDEELDLSGGFLRVTFRSADGYYEDISLTADMFDSLKLSGSGVKVITVRWEGYTVSFVVQISAHSFTEWATVTEATLLEEGEESRHCTVDGCGHKETRPIAALGPAAADGITSALEEGTLQLDNIPEGIAVFIAVYTDGQLVHADSGTSADGTLTFLLPEEAADLPIRLFFLTEGWVPIAPPRNI